MKAILFIALQVQINRYPFKKGIESVTEVSKQLRLKDNLESIITTGTLGHFGQVSVSPSQVSDIFCPGFKISAVRAGVVHPLHPDVEEGEEEDDHQDADHGAVHFPKLPTTG